MKFVEKPLGETQDISRSKDTVGEQFKLLAIVSIAAAVLYALTGLAAQALIGTISEATEVQLLADMSKAAVPDLIDDERAQRIFERLVEQPGLRPYPYTLRKLPMKVPNAGALPGGVIGVTPALLTTVRSDIGLAMVIAHELGHHHHRHGLHRLGRSILWIAFKSLFSTDFTGGHALGLQLLESGHSRDEEREADEFGLRLVYATYGDLTNATEFFEWADQSHGTAESLSRFVSSHPMSAERIRNMKRLAASLQAPSSTIDRDQ
ncbi:MAG: M48 family metallopeptidase [Myxococcota bacterium]|nr:M48 family metallopeptidase [Myxococcota bacterium]